MVIPLYLPTMSKGNEQSIVLFNSLTAACLKGNRHTQIQNKNKGLVCLVFVFRFNYAVAYLESKWARAQYNPI